MKSIKKIFDQLNIVAQCKKYNVSLWQCPQFLFMVMGSVVIISALLAYLTGTRYIQDPLLVSLITLILTGILFVVSVIVTRSFERLAEANQMKSQFISIATHQLRSPLSNLRWAIELLVSGKLTNEKKQAEYFSLLKENIKRMQNSISDLLIVSRIEAARLPIKEEKISLKELTESLISEYNSFARASNVEIALDVQKDLPKISSDPFQLNLVVDNLLDNAIRYTENKGKIEISVVKKNKNIHFSIKDNGVGIPEEEQSFIFTKFFRSKKIAEHQTQGSGLGLYMSKAIIQRLKGKIGFKSKEGKGSTFWFSLPIRP